MQAPKTLIYDGSFNGFLTAIYNAFSENVIVTDIKKNSEMQPLLFSHPQTIFSEISKAKTVWQVIENKNPLAIKTIYFAFLSENSQIELLLYKYIQKLFSVKLSEKDAYDNGITHKINHLAKMVSREKYRLEISLKFQKTVDNIHFTTVESEHNMLPLLSKHFRTHNLDRSWLMYDGKRNFGLYYDKKKVEMISLNYEVIDPHTMMAKSPTLGTDSKDHYMWNNYFTKHPIKPFINKKLYSSLVANNTKDYSMEKRAV